MLPKVSVVVPCRNEVGHLQVFLDSLSRQENVPGGLEILIVDGISDDGSREYLVAASRADSRIRVLDNPPMIVSTAMNMAIRASKGEIIVRMDVHTDYADDYILECVTALETMQADNVGGPACARGDGYMQTAIALAYNSPFSVGGAKFHDPSYEGWVDTLPYGCWRKDIFESIGLFDETLVRNQDDEHNLRIIRSGGRVWQTPRIRSWYKPRATLRALWRQYVQYGYWKVRVIKIHRIPASFRHVVPATVSIVFLLLVVCGLFWPIAWVVAGALLAAYVAGLVVATVSIAFRAEAVRYIPVLPVVLATFHCAYAVGFLGGLFDTFFRRTKIRSGFSALTR